MARSSECVTLPRDSAWAARRKDRAVYLHVSRRRRFNISSSPAEELAVARNYRLLRDRTDAPRQVESEFIMIRV